MAGCTPPDDGEPAEAVADTPSAEPAPVPQTAQPDTNAADTADSEPESTETTADVDTSIREAAAFGDDTLLEGLAPDGWKQAGDIEHYNVARLYDKIDGRSELYMSYDVVGLSWVSIVHNDNPNLFMDVFVYDMGTTTAAFGIYSVEREPDQPKVDLGREGYRTDAHHFFWKGKYYAYVQCSLDEGIEAGLQVAKTIDERLPDSGGEIEGLDLVPTEGIVDDTIQFFRADAMALDFMNNTYTAHYTVDGMDVNAFMTRRESPEEAEEIATKFTGYLEEYGEDVAKHEAEGTEITIGDLGGGFFDGVFRIDNVTAGVSAVEGAEATVKAATAILQKLRAN